MAGFDRDKYEQIQQQIKTKTFSPLYFFCGEEDYFIDVLVNHIEQDALSDMEKGFNQTILYGKDIDARIVVETCRRLPMMANFQLVIIKEAQSFKDLDQLTDYFKKPVPTTILVFAFKHGTPDKRKIFYKELTKTGVYFESVQLYDNQIAPWVVGYLSKKGVKIESKAAELLVESTGNDLTKIANELDKLILNKPNGGQIILDDIETSVGVSKEYNSFELNNAIGAKNVSKAYRIVNYFVSNPKNGPLVLILGMLSSYFSKVYLLQTNKNLGDKELAGLLKVSPYFVKDYKEAGRHYSILKLEKIFLLLEEYDLRSKGINNTGNVADGELMKELVYKILHP